MTNFTSLSTGGGEGLLRTEPMPLPTMRGTIVRADGTYQIKLLKGTLISRLMILPDAANPATAGNVTVGTAADMVRYSAASPLNTAKLAAASNVEMLAADTMIHIVCIGIAGGRTRVALEVVEPLKRA